MQNNNDEIVKKYNEVVKVIHEVNPSILDLAMGCEVYEKGVLYKVIHSPFNDIGKEQFNVYLIDPMTEIFVFGGDHLKKNCQIYGRKITLTDVMYAIGEKYPYIVYIDSAGQFHMAALGGMQATQIKWNRLDDNLLRQSPEVIILIHKLICQETNSEPTETQSTPSFKPEA